MALKSEWITRNPFMQITIRMERVDREYLTDVELEMLREKEFKINRLQRVKDIFVFCCYTGLAYADVERLSADHLQHSIEGSKKIILKIKRKKTAVPCRIPLLPFAIDILKKYEDDPYCIHRGVLLPTLTNQKMNAYLKEIADLCGIKKELTTHLARHTFATTVTLAQGIPIWIVQKMLGHANIQSTQVYARVLDTSIDEAMSQIANRFTSEPVENSPVKRLTGTK